MTIELKNMENIDNNSVNKIKDFIYDWGDVKLKIKHQSESYDYPYMYDVRLAENKFLAFTTFMANEFIVDTMYIKKIILPEDDDVITIVF